MFEKFIVKKWKMLHKYETGLNNEKSKSYLFVKENNRHYESRQQPGKDRSFNFSMIRSHIYVWNVQPKQFRKYEKLLVSILKYRCPTRKLSCLILLANIFL